MRSSIPESDTVSVMSGETSKSRPITYNVTNKCLLDVLKANLTSGDLKTADR